MKYNPYAEITHMHHTARWFSTLERWAVIDQDQRLVATVATITTKHRDPRGPKRRYTTTELTITLALDWHGLLLEPITRPGGMRTALRWVCQELNNGHLWLSTRLALEREARLLDYDESGILACGHAYDYQYCLALLTNLPGLAENWPKR